MIGCGTVTGAREGEGEGEREAGAPGGARLPLGVRVPVGVTRTEDDRLELGEAAGDFDGEAPGVTRAVGVPLGVRVGVGVGVRVREAEAGALKVGGAVNCALREAAAESAGEDVAAAEAESCVGKAEALPALEVLGVDEAKVVGLLALLALPLLLASDEALAEALLEAAALPLEMGLEEGEEELDVKGDKVSALLGDERVEGDTADALAQTLDNAEREVEAHLVAVELTLDEPQLEAEEVAEEKPEAVLLLLPLAAADGDTVSVSLEEGEAVSQGLGEPLLLELPVA